MGELETMNNMYAGKGTAGAGLGLGIAGTALGLLNMGGNGLTIGGRFVNNGSSDDAPVTRYEVDLMRQISDKNSQISTLTANQFATDKIGEASMYILNKLEKVEDEVHANRNRQDDINLEQAVYNGTNTAAIQCLRTDLTLLQNSFGSLVQLKIPATSLDQVALATVKTAAAST